MRSSRIKATARLGVVATLMSLATVTGTTPAAANVVANTAPTSYTGGGFDMCNAPATSELRAWSGLTTMRAVNIYMGGVDRACRSQPNLTAGWVATLAAAGWRFIPTYVGLQAPCQSGKKKYTIDPSIAARQGRQNAYDAITTMRALGLGPDNPVYFDMEPWNYDNTTCRSAVSRFLDGWTYRLHSYGYLSGVYGSRASTVRLLVEQYPSTRHRRPDDIWYANYDGRDRTWGEPTIPSSYWQHHRLHQYAAEVAEPSWPTVDGRTVYVDKDAVDGDVATPDLTTALEPYAVSGTRGTNGLNERTAPTTSAPTIGTPIAEGTSLSITCQTVGDDVDGSNVWDRLSDGGYVSDLYTTTPGGLSWAGTLPRCDGMPAGHLDTPANGVTLEAGRPLTLGGSFSGSVASVTFSVRAGSGAWTAVGTDAHGGDGHYQVTWSPAWTNGARVQVKATATSAATSADSNVRQGIRIVDTTPPRVTLGPLAPAALTRYARLSWSATDAGAGIADYDVRYRKASYAGRFGRWTYRSAWTGTTRTHVWLRLAPGYDYCYQVRARDLVGNVSGWSVRRCVARALDDRALSARTGAWHRRTGSAYYLGTFTGTTSRGQVLALAGARLRRVGVIATTCPTCGAVSVYVAGRWVGRIDLAAPRRQRQQVLLLPRFSYRAGTVTVRSVTSGRIVQVDGLLASRT